MFGVTLWRATCANPLSRPRLPLIAAIDRRRTVTSDSTYAHQGTKEYKKQLKDLFSHMRTYIPRHMHIYIYTYIYIYIYIYRERER